MNYFLTVPCPPGTPVARCFARPCDVTKCAKYPDAICVDSYCGGCRAIFYYQGKKLDRLACCKCTVAEIRMSIDYGNLLLNDLLSVDFLADPMCEVPQSFQNGYFKPNSRYIAIGKTVEYTCNTGYKRIGSSRRRCVVRSGKPKLTGSHPNCQGNFLFS